MNRIIIASTSNNSSIIRRGIETSILKEITIPLQLGENIIDDLKYGFYFDYTCQNENIESINLSNYDTSNISDMKFMFYNCKKIKSIDLSNFNTSNVDDGSFLFANCVNLSSLCLVNWDTSKITNTQFMFYNCKKIKNLDLSNFNTSNMINMSYMFASCNNLISLDLSNFDMSTACYVEYMFANCNSLNYIKCKQLFKEFCLRNQDIVLLPESMREGGNGVWEIID